MCIVMIGAGYVVLGPEPVLPISAITCITDKIATLKR